MFRLFLLFSYMVSCFPWFVFTSRFSLASFIFIFSVVEIFPTDKKNPVYFVEKLQSLERQIALEIETSRASEITKGTYAAIYHNSEKILEMNEGTQSFTLVPIFSISKPFTAFAVLKLAEGGYIKFHDPITKHIPEFKELAFLRNEPITIKDLLHHTSGLPTSFTKLWLKLPIGSKEYDIPLQTHRAGDRFIYSNYNYQILAKLVENVSTQTLGDYLTEILFEPLSIKNVKLENYNGASGLVVSPEVLFQFANILLRQGKVGDEQFIMKKTIKNFFKKPSNFAKAKQYYGFGWFIELSNKDITKVWHAGRGDTTYCYLKIYPKKKIISIFYNSGTKKKLEKFSKMNIKLEKTFEEYINYLQAINFSLKNNHANRENSVVE